MNTQHSRLLRLWHWLNAITIFGLIGTFFLRETFLSWNANAKLITAKLASMHIDITSEQARTIAKAIRAPMWEWHIILGFVLGGLLLLRLLILIIEKGFNYENDGTIHSKMVHLGYKVLYLIIAYMVLSGLVMEYHDALGIGRDFAHTLEEIHQFFAWAIIFFIPAHLIGIIIADNTTQKGLASKMVSG